MQHNGSDCPICLQKYDLSLHLPRIVPICGHTICSQCIPSLLNPSQDFTCPVGQEVHPGNYPNIDSFPHNFALQYQIEKAQEFGFCKDHDKELQYICLEDKAKVCNECVLFGEHSGHKVKSLIDLKPAMGKKIRQLQEVLHETEEWQKNLEKTYQHQRKETLDLVSSRFRDLRFVLNAKEAEFMYRIDSFYEREIGKLHSQLGESSVKQVIKEKIDKYHQITKDPHPLELMEEDLTPMLGIIQDGMSLEKIDNINVLLQQLKVDVNFVLSNQLEVLEKMEIFTSEYSKMMQNVVDLNLDEKLYGRQEAERSQPILLNLTQNDMKIEGNQLFISYPFHANINQNLKAIQELEHGHGENLPWLEFRIKEKTEKISQQDISTLSYIRSRFPAIKNLRILIEDSKVSDEALFNIFCCLFWKNEFLQTLTLEDNTEGLFEKSILYLAENVLPSASYLKQIRISFRNCEATSKAWASLSQAISQLSQHLTHLHFVVPCQNIDADSLQTFFVSFPNLEFFASELFSSAFDDQVLEAFISNTLPSLKKLTNFQLFIDDAAVTDLSVQKLFKAFPVEWWSQMTCLRVGLANTNITDKSLREFVQENLARFKALNHFAIYTKGSSVSSDMENEISRWEQYLSIKQKQTSTAGVFSHHF